MKVKNIVFSGFAAAILMGTAGANAATPFKIASQAYVDSKVSTGLVDESTGNPISVADALAGKANASVVDTLDEQINGNGTTTSGLAGEVSDLQDALGSGFDENNTVADAIDSKADADALGAGIGTGEGQKTVAAALADKVNVADKATTIGSTASASDDKWVTEKAVADALSSVTGGAGSVSQQIEDALGDLGTGNTTVADALADKADASTIAGANETLDSSLNSSTVVGAINTLDGRVDTLESTVATDTEVAGLLGDGISTSSTVTQQLANKQNALSPDQLNSITAAATLLAAGYQTCISQSGGSGHCVLTAASNGLTWTDVTSPFEITE